MDMADFDLFAWWAITITGGSIFLTLVSIYLYISSRPKRKASIRTTGWAVALAKDFFFVWVLLGLLIFYIVSINIGSLYLFAAGNIIVEVILIVYSLKNRRSE
jgi:hypothetical protein